jgi:hypothetical protein
MKNRFVFGAMFATIGGKKFLIWDRYMHRLHRSVPSALPDIFAADRVEASLVGISRLQTWITSLGVWSFIFVVASLTANAQFKTIGPPPFSPTVARQKVRTLLDNVDPSNRQQAVGTINGWLAWYRDIIDEELIAAWRKDTRANLTDVVESLADSRVAMAVVNFSWREQRQAAFNLSAAPMLGHLLARFPESAKPFLDDLLGRPTPDLSEAEAEAVCRILMDMPDIGTWRNSALQILPHYRQAAENIVAQDVRGSDQEKRYQALRWENDLRLHVSEMANEQPSARRRPMRSPSPATDRASNGDRPVFVLTPPAEADRASAPTANSSAPAHVPAPPAPSPSASPAEHGPPVTPAAPSPLPARPPVPSASVPSVPQYAGPRSGTLESTGNPIPQNAEYVFRNLPPVKIQLDYDTKIWDARLAAGEGQTQRLIVKNKSSGPQKRCVVHWSVIP